jgi:hypothetical protein
MNVESIIEKLAQALNAMLVAVDTSAALPEGHPGHEAYLNTVAIPRAREALKLAADHSDPIVRFGIATKAGNRLEFFYNPDNDLVVVDLSSKHDTGGTELLRVTLKEKAMLKHCPKELPEPIETGDVELEFPESLLRDDA